MKQLAVGSGQLAVSSEQLAVEPRPVVRVQCSHTDSCLIADTCLFGEPHDVTPNDAAARRCYDYRPHITGGLMVWADIILPPDGGAA